jgi:YHS domain-containing protein
MTKCPVCGRDVDAEAVRTGTTKTKAGVAVVNPDQGTRSLHEGKWYYLCNNDCRSKFMANPDRYIQATA